MQSATARSLDPSSPPGGRKEAWRAALTYGRLAVFAGACALYLVARYVLLGQFRGPGGERDPRG